MGHIRSIIKSKQAKGAVIYSVTPETFVYNALEIMFDKNISAILIIENDKPVGIFTERDYARKIALQGRSSKETTIREIMSKDLITITTDSSIEDAMQIMTTKLVRHLPVMDGDLLVGIVSIGDVVKFIIDEQQFIIGNLERYISHS